MKNSSRAQAALVKPGRRSVCLTFFSCRKVSSNLNPAASVCSEIDFLDQWIHGSVLNPTNAAILSVNLSHTDATSVKTPFKSCSLFQSRFFRFVLLFFFGCQSGWKADPSCLTTLFSNTTSETVTEHLTALLENTVPLWQGCCSAHLAMKMSNI